MSILENTICSPEALSWLSEYLSTRTQLSLKVEIGADRKYFILSDDEGKLFVIPRFQSNNMPNSNDVVSFDYKDAAHPHISTLFAFRTKNTLKNAPSPFMMNDGFVSFFCDPLSFIYFQLTRIEELETSDLDRHERFKAKNALAYHSKFLSYPVVDHWVEVIAQNISRIRLSYTRPTPKYELLLTHDVDVPYRYNFINPLMLGKFVAGRIVRREFTKLFDFGSYLLGRKSDPADTFDFIMSLSELHNIKSEFYFIPDRTSPWMDGNYNLEQSKIKNLIKNIWQRGHSIGAHFSYNTFRSKTKIAHEHKKLERILNEVSQDLKPCGGSRMHYLRWQSWITAQNLSKSNILYDTTLGFAEQTGFRCGTCHSYKPFDPITLAIIPLKIIPLTIMEGTIWGENYMGLTDEKQFLNESFDMIRKVYDVGGICNILWHNSDLSEDWQRSLYSKVLDYAKNPT